MPVVYKLERRDDLPTVGPIGLNSCQTASIGNGLWRLEAAVSAFFLEAQAREVGIAADMTNLKLRAAIGADHGPCAVRHRQGRPAMVAGHGDQLDPGLR